MSESLLSIQHDKQGGAHVSSAHVPVRRFPRHRHLAVAGVHGHRHRPAGRLLRRGRRLRWLGLVRAGRPGGAGVLHRLPGGAIAVDGQRVRHGDDLRLLRHPPPLPAPGAVLGHPRGDRAACADDRPGHRAGEGVRLDSLHLRRLPAVHRGEDAVQPRRGRARPVAEPRAAVRAPAHAGHRRDTWRALLRAPEGRLRPHPALGHPAVPRPGADRTGRPGVRRRQRAGDLLHHPGPLHRLHLEHLRHPRPALAVLRPGRADAPLRLPQVRPRPGADLHRRQDLPAWIHRQDSRAALSWRNLWPACRWRAAVPVQDAQPPAGLISRRLRIDARRADRSARTTGSSDLAGKDGPARGELPRRARRAHLRRPAAHAPGVAAPAARRRQRRFPGTLPPPPGLTPGRA
ncbi:hypothetical protein Lal_00012464 [Lupinus albus]|nr:hypothetical protein Lal_00012464 [Lupinus albus]